mmetsp:Transcript_149011/g.371259  ORF Transcript_149011/g.371259 Transcript_149011/m.371259 type:complete len:220 (-) Transcript_149011:901-1560(-)
MRGLEVQEHRRGPCGKLAAQGHRQASRSLPQRPRHLLPQTTKRRPPNPASPVSAELPSVGSVRCCPPSQSAIQVCPNQYAARPFPSGTLQGRQSEGSTLLAQQVLPMVAPKMQRVTPPLGGLQKAPEEQHQESCPRTRRRGRATEWAARVHQISLTCSMVRCQDLLRSGSRARRATRGNIPPKMALQDPPAHARAPDLAGPAPSPVMWTSAADQNARWS